MANFIQWNINGFHCHKEELRILEQQYTPLVMLLQETHFLPSTTATHRGFSIFRKDIQPQPGSRAHGGVAILIADFLPAKPILLSTPLQAVAIRTVFNRSITLCSLYLPPNSTVSPTDLDHLLKQLPQPFLIAGDFNAHGPLWDNVRLSSDARRKVIESLLQSGRLNLLNTGEVTHQSATYHSTSAIDLTVCHPALPPDFEWNVHNDRCGSDHWPIILHYLPYAPPSRPLPKWAINRADWSLYQAKFEPITQTTSSVDDDLKFLLGTIEDAALAAMGKT